MKPQHLHKMQSLFQKAIIQETLAEELASVISEKPPITLAARLKIYQEAYRNRTTESIKDDFPSFGEKYGEENFNELIDKFVQSYPSQVRNLSEYSETFLQYLIVNCENFFSDSIGVEIVETAIRDWLSILSERSVPAEAVLTLAEISEGLDFNLQCHPSVKFFEAFENYYLSHLKNDELVFKKMSSKDFLIVKYLNSVRSPDELLQHLISSGFEVTEIQKIIADAIRDQVVVCLKL